MQKISTEGPTRKRAPDGFTFRQCSGCGAIGRLRTRLDADGIVRHLNRDELGILRQCDGEVTERPVLAGRNRPRVVNGGVWRADQ